MKAQRQRLIFGYVILILLLIALAAVNICAGSAEISLKRLMNALQHPQSDRIAYNIITGLRLPRTAAAFVLGGALSVSGFLLQNFFANPIAGPYILGISSGAKLMVALLMVLSLARGFAVNSFAMVAAAFVGAMISMGLILLISGKVKRMSVLIVCGVMIGYICSAVTDFIVNFSDDSNIVNLHNWSMGSFSGIGKTEAVTAAVIVFPACFCAFLLSKPMNAYQLGEEYAVNSGVRIKAFRAALILLSSILSACVTAFAGPVSFVGVAVPHLIKSFFRTAKPIRILPACFLGGAVFCLLCDLITRTVFAPNELSISTVTSVFGAPVVIYMLLHKERRAVNE
ncbi:FecCD family ABC transporter permease [Ruminococcus flavefaciens]|uniref:FecCD family ABC transporter permease n=1 Tax=Ruminococcus flavefaciens TaxID=1265 RepID=UPI0026EF3958|nr:iron ABC transporter permease [Ruminococcus flavefaciens]MDD7516588.1 iron ABC transporter permease [Ruminococcus flavefaciens]MDY5690035.1 iron ABC transporter permease [Ruminococcus flavefaciens]